MVNASKGAMRRPFDCAQGRLSGRTCLRWLSAGPKGKGFSAWFANRSQAALDTEPGVKHRPKAAQSGYTERWNRPALSAKTE
jgi:hypothetical protein